MSEIDARPAPSQNDDLTQAHAIGHKMGLLAGTDISPIREALAAVRAEATLAGAAAERERLAQEFENEERFYLAAAIRARKP